MCTLTVVWAGNATHNESSSAQDLIITMNRDEADWRNEGVPVSHPENKRWQYWHPVDAQAGGTWFGVHREGWVFALLNRYQDQVVSGAVRPSRGEIIPSYLKKGSFDQVKEAFFKDDLSQYAACDLWCVHRNEKLLLSWDGQQHRRVVIPNSGAFLTYSSSVDYIEAGEYRNAAFKSVLDAGGATQDLLLALHARSCAENTSLGFNMLRPHRHTKSICQVVLPAAGGASSVRYLQRDDNGAFSAIG